jgi:hypothetical protein
MDVFRLLTLTYPRYTDSGSRDAVEEVVMELVRRDERRGTPNGPPDETRLGVAEQVLGWLSNEVGRFAKGGIAKYAFTSFKSASTHHFRPLSSYAPSDIYVLLSWACGLYTVCVKHNPDFITSNSWRVLVGSMALLLDMLMESTQAKPSLKHGGLVLTRRCFTIGVSLQPFDFAVAYVC